MTSAMEGKRFDLKTPTALTANSLEITCRKQVPELARDRKLPQQCQHLAQSRQSKWCYLLNNSSLKNPAGNGHHSTRRHDRGVIFRQKMIRNDFLAGRIDCKLLQRQSFEPPFRSSTDAKLGWATEPCGTTTSASDRPLNSALSTEGIDVYPDFLFRIVQAVNNPVNHLPGHFIHRRANRRDSRRDESRDGQVVRQPICHREHASRGSGTPG